MDLWLLQDKLFQMPRAIVTVILLIPHIVDSPLKKAQFCIFEEILMEKVS